MYVCMMYACLCARTYACVLLNDTLPMFIHVYACLCISLQPCTSARVCMCSVDFNCQLGLELE